MHVFGLSATSDMFYSRVKCGSCLSLFFICLSDDIYGYCFFFGMWRRVDRYCTNVSEVIAASSFSLETLVSTGRHIPADTTSFLFTVCCSTSFHCIVSTASDSLFPALLMTPSSLCCTPNCCLRQVHSMRLVIQEEGNSLHSESMDQGQNLGPDGR
jgi:hypothetical protein